MNKEELLICKRLRNEATLYGRIFLASIVIFVVLIILCYYSTNNPNIWALVAVPLGLAFFALWLRKYTIEGIESFIKRR